MIREKRIEKGDKMIAENRKIIEIRLIDAVPFYGAYVMLKRALEAGEHRFYPRNVLVTHLVIYANFFCSVIGILILLGLW